MKRIIIATAVTFSMIAAIALGVGFSGSGLPLKAHAQEEEQLVNTNKDVLFSTCSVGTVRGSYAYSAQGTILAGAPVPPQTPTGLYATLGRITFDGNGNFTSIANDNFNGLIVPPANFTGTYTVNQNCTGSAFVNGGVPYKFTVVDDGKEILFMIDVPGTIISGAAKKQ